jgi:hypothetical protein
LQAYLIINDHCLRLVSHYDPACVISEDVVSLDSGEAAPTREDAATRIFVNVVLAHLRGAVKHCDAIVVVMDPIVLDPAVAAFYNKYAFGATRVYVVINNYRIT